MRTLRPRLREIWERNCSVYRWRKLTKAARKAGLEVGRDQVARLTRTLDVRGATRAKRRFTTNIGPAAVRAPDLAQRDFAATRPNEKWVADFKCCSTLVGDRVRRVRGRRVLATHRRRAGGAHHACSTR